MRKYKIYYLNGTHWDREWYLPFQEFRYNLVKMVDDMVWKLQNDENFKLFTFDGQTIVLEDYKEIAKDRAEKLQKLIEEGRILVGPWYVMPDELLVSGESIIRNLILGEKVAKEWNTKPWKYGYVNDVFGHIAQMPQIFAGFDIKGGYLGRGVGDKTQLNHFVWKSPDDTEMLVYNGYYGWFALTVANHFGKADFTDKLKGYLDEEISKSDIPIILISNTQDHFLADGNSPKIIKIIKKEYPDCEVEFVSLEKMVEEQEKYRDKMPVARGELIEPLHSEVNRITGQLVSVPNSISSYYPLKQLNDKKQNLLEHVIEPMLALSLIENKRLDHTYVDLAYRYLLKNQPHDSICGCSVDRVHKDMIYRYDQIESISDALKYDFLENKYDGSGNSYILRIFNFDTSPKNQVITVDLSFKKNFKKDANRFTKNEPINSFVIKNKQGEEIPYQINSIIHDKVTRTTTSANIFTDVYNVSFEASLSAFGYNDFAVVESDCRVVYDEGLFYTDHSAENEYLKIDIAPNGEISVYDKITGKSYNGLNRFTDGADFGDGWFFMPPVNDKIISSYSFPAQISRLKSGAVSVSFEIIKILRLPKEFDEKAYNRSDETVDVTIKSVVTLYKGSKYLDIKTEIENIAKDHRLQMVIPTGIASEDYYVSQAFAKITRKTGLESYGKRYYETEQLEKNMSGIVGIKSEDSGFAFVSAEGLHEAGVKENGDIHITMLRSFRKVILEPNAKLSQIQGKQSFHYAFCPTDSNTSYSNLLNIQRNLEDNMLYSFKNVETDNLSEKSLVSLSNDNIILSIIKTAENEDGIILRFYNASDYPQSTKISLDFDIKGVWSTKLNEEKKEIIANSKEFELSFKPWEIKTILVLLTNK